MAVFDELYRDMAVPLLLEQFGELFTYTLAGNDTACTGQVGRIEVREEDAPRGKRISRTREVTIQTSDVAAVQTNAKVTIDGEVWPIKQILNKTPVTTRVELCRAGATK